MNQSLPSALREALEMAELLMHDAALQVVEGRVPLSEFEEARAMLRRVMAHVTRYLRYEAEHAIFAFPRPQALVPPPGH